MFGNDLKMSDSYLEQRVNIQPSAKLENYVNKNSDMLKGSYNDKYQEQNFLKGTTNVEKV